MKPVLRILEPGLAASLQDCGRPGLQRFGVPVCGALDTVSLALANILAGNPPGTAGDRNPGCWVRVRDRGGKRDAGAGGNGWRFYTAERGRRYPRSGAAERQRPARRYRPHPPAKGGAVSYLAVEGGFDVAPVLGSRSTYRRAALGGYRGRSFPSGRRPAALPCFVEPRSRPHQGRYSHAGCLARDARPQRGVFQPWRF